MKQRHNDGEKYGVGSGQNPFWGGGRIDRTYSNFTIDSRKR